jgi:TRAP-type mannitol/chloroaromatic compound transport system substrate-binding protein
MKRREFLAGSVAGLGIGAAAGVALDPLSRAVAQKSTLPNPAIVSGCAVGTTWKVQTSWPGGIGLEIFTRWCESIVEKTGGELAFKPYGAKDLVGEFQLFEAVQNGVLDAMNPFTLYWAGRMPAAAFLSSYPAGLRNSHEWDVFYYQLGGLEMARALFANHDMHYVGPIHHGANIIHSKVPIRSVEDFRGRRMRLPGGMVAELFQAAGAKTALLPGSEIFPALEAGTIDVADYVGPAINYALGFHKVTKYISMGPPGLMSIYQPVDLMDLTVGMGPWSRLPAALKRFIEMEVHVYSDLHHAAIQAADQDAWKKFEEAGSVITRLSAADVDQLTKLAIPLWFRWANKDKAAAKVFKVQLDYMMSGSLGYITPKDIAGLSLHALS